MNPEQTPFITGWWGTDLGKYRPCDGTYCFYPYDSLPLLDMTLFRSELQWLEPLSNALDQTMDIYRPDQAEQDKLAARLAKLTTEAAQKGLTLPAPFLKLMGSRALQNQIPSCTACYFKLADEIIKSPFDDNGYFLRFLHDQQDVLVWYLYLTPNGDECVVVSSYFFEEDPDDPDLIENLKQDVAFCAPSFESFLYRFWLENHIWFAMEEVKAFTPVQQAYLDHYKKENAS